MLVSPHSGPELFRVVASGKTHFLPSYQPGLSCRSLYFGVSCVHNSSVCWCQKPATLRNNAYITSDDWSSVARAVGFQPTHVWVRFPPVR